MKTTARTRSETDIRRVVRRHFRTFTRNRDFERRLRRDIEPLLRLTRDRAAKAFLIEMDANNQVVRRALTQALLDDTYPRDRAYKLAADMVKTNRAGYDRGVVRATLVSITETTGAVSAGQQIARDVVLAVTGKTHVLIWQTHHDERVCPLCKPLDKMVESRWRKFAPGGAPLHPRCRCSLQPRAMRGVSKPPAVGDERRGSYKGTAFPDNVALPMESLREEWDETKHPRGDDGRFIDKEKIESSAKDPIKAASLMKQVTDPDEKKKLLKQLKNAGMDTATYRKADELAKRTDVSTTSQTRQRIDVEGKIAELDAKQKEMQEKLKDLYDQQAKYKGLSGADWKAKYKDSKEDPWSKMVDEIKQTELALDYLGPEKKLYEAIAATPVGTHTRDMLESMISDDGNKALQNVFKNSVPGGSSVLVFPTGEVRANGEARAEIKKTIVGSIANKLGQTEEVNSEHKIHYALADLIAVDKAGGGYTNASNFETLRHLAMNEISDKNLDDYGMKKELSQKIIDTWATSSTDGNSTSIALQSAVRNKFGDAGEIQGTDSQAHTASGEKLYQAHKDVFDSVVNVIYNDTQDQLKAAGVEKVTLFRGMSVPNGTASGELTLDMNPVSSFAMDYGTARGFGVGGEYDENMMHSVSMVEVPRERIFCTSVNGLGCLTESEVLVTGEAPLKGRIVTRTPPQSARDRMEGRGIPDDLKGFSDALGES